MARRTKLLDLEGFEPQLVAESTTGEVFVLDDDTEEFAQILRDASPADVLEEDGLVSQYEQCCRNRALMYMENHQPEKARPWAQEANTWRLVRILFSHRHATETNMDTAAERVAASENIFKSDFVRADEIWADRELQEHLLVKEWMEMIAPDFQAVEIRKGHFPHTAMHIRGQKRIGASTAASALGIPSFADQIVSELDPDAMTRQHRRVVPEDQAYESELVRTIFEYVRRGRIADALDLCHACDQTWRAMSLSGGMLRVDSFVDGEATEDSGDVRGNENVVLWKATCYQLAMDEQADPYERATYALLSGDIKNVLPVCHSWEDHVWARYNAFIENQSLKRMSGIPRPAFADQEIGLPLPHFDQRPEDIFNALTHSDDPRINKESTEAFHVIQAHVILDSIDRLFDDLKTQLVRIESGAASVPRIEHLPQVLRFSAHLVRLMCDLGYSELSDGAEFVVGRYIHLLQVGQKGVLSPMYVALLPSEAQVESYASFLSEVQDSFEVRRELTVAGGECSLDMVRICLVTVDKIFRRSSIRDMLQESVPPVQLCMTTDQVPESDDVLVRALEWLDMDHSQTEDKFDHANFLLRRFLIQGHVQSAKHLRNELGISDETLRDMVGREGDAVTMAREWTLWATLVDCIESFATWTRTFFQERPKPDRRSQRESEWANKVRTVSGAALGRMKLVLQVFMAPDYLAPTHSVAEQRELELELVRSIYVPEIVMWMHQILLQTHTIVPGNLEESLKLANVVAGSAGSDMYEQFKRSNKLGLFMRAMRESALAMLEAGHRIFDR